MPVILLTNHYSEQPKRIIKQQVPEGFDFVTLDKAAKDNLLALAPQADYFLVSGRVPIDSDVIEAAVKLKMVQRTGVGIEMLDTQTLKEKGIPVYVNRGVNADSVAEHTLMLILSVLRRLSVLDASVKCGQWRKQELGVQCHELKDKVVGLIGLGSIGLKVAGILNAFNAKVIYFDSIRIGEEKEKELGISFQPFSDLLKQVDVLSLHCPLSVETEGMIGYKELRSMKKGAIVINTSRES